MATVYSEKYWTGAYTYTRVRVDYSGGSATAILLYSRTNAYAGATGFEGYPISAFNFGGGSVNINSAYFYGAQTDAEICRCSFSINPSSGGTYSGNTTGKMASSLLAFSGSVYIPAQNSQPTGLSVSVAEVYTNGAKFNVSISSYGVPNGVDGRWIEAGIAGQNAWQSPSLRSAVVRNVTSAQITVNNSSPQTTTLNVRPNTQYYYGGHATNTVMSVSTIAGKLVTKAEAPTVSFVDATPISANFRYNFPADGGFYDRTLQYTLDGTTWRTVTTVSGGTAQTGTFTVNGLLSGTAYTMQVKVVTTAGETTGSNVLFNTLVGEEDNKNIFYGSVSGRAREARILYGSVNDEARPIIRLYGAVNDPDSFTSELTHPTSYWLVQSFDPDIFKAKMIASQSSIWENRNSFDHLEVISPMATTPDEGLATGDGTSFYLDKTLPVPAKTIAYHGNATQNGTPSVPSPAPISVVTGAQSVAISDNDETTQSFTINLGSTVLCKIGDYHDYIYKQGSNWYIHKETGTAIYDGSDDELWRINSPGTPQYLYESRKVISDYAYLEAGTGGLLCTVGTGARIGSDNTFEGVRIIISNYFRVRSGSEMSLPDWKSYLSSNPITLYYVLKKATNTKITNATLISQLNALAEANLYSGGTSFLSATSANLPATLHVEAYTSLRKYYLWLCYKDATRVQLYYGDEDGLDEYGTTLVSPKPLPSHETLDCMSLSPKIVARLIHQGFGHIDYS